MPGEGLTHGPPAVKKAGGSHHRFSRIIRHSPRDGFNAYIVLSLGTGLSCPHCGEIISRQLSASVGAPGPHDFAVRIGIARPARPTRPSQPASRSVTIGQNALCIEAGRGHHTSDLQNK
jgi:hypothetical protein